MDGTSDDLDVVLKAIFRDVEFVAEHNLSCMNSINWARVMAQITHSFYAYFQVSIQSIIMVYYLLSCCRLVCFNALCENFYD